MHVIEHHIQRRIIDRLMQAECLRFKDLKPDGMESNIFMYHLKQLIKQDFVAKTDQGYTLTPRGLTYVDNLSTDSKQYLQPKHICILAIRDAKGRWLVAQRKTQPFIGKYMLPSGKQRLGESIEQHVRRELQKKFGIAASAVRCGTAEVMLHDEMSRTLLTHVVGQVYVVTIETLDLPQETDQYKYSWRDDVGKLDFLPGTQELMQKIKDSKEYFFFSYSNLA